MHLTSVLCPIHSAGLAPGGSSSRSRPGRSAAWCSHVHPGSECDTNRSAPTLWGILASPRALRPPPRTSKPPLFFKYFFIWVRGLCAGGWGGGGGRILSFHRPPLPAHRPFGGQLLTCAHPGAAGRGPLGAARRGAGGGGGAAGGGGTGSTPQPPAELGHLCAPGGASGSRGAAGSGGRHGGCAPRLGAGARRAAAEPHPRRWEPRPGAGQRGRGRLQGAAAGRGAAAGFAGRPGRKKRKKRKEKRKSFVCMARGWRGVRKVHTPSSPSRAVLTINYLLIGTKCPRGEVLLEQ